MKTLATAALLALTALLSGCSMGLPLPPPWMLMMIHNDTTPPGTPDPAQTLPMGDGKTETAPAPTVEPAAPLSQPAAPDGESALA